MMGQLDRQATFHDLEWMSAIPRDSFWWRLRDWAVENLREEDFKEMFKDSGRPSVSPIHTFLALLIQLEKGYSDREMEEESRYDDRVKLALLASRNFKGIDAATLCVHRKRFLEHSTANRFFERVLASAKEKGLFSKDNLHIVDSFMIHGAAAVQDTYTLIRKGILRTLRIARLHGLEEPLRATLRRTDYDEPGKPKIDWDDPEARRQLLEELVHDALRLVEAARALPQRPPDLDYMADLLKKVAEQDVVFGFHGRVELLQGTVQDRIISVHDPEMRYGHKTASKVVPGYKAHILTAGDDGQLIAGVDLTPANDEDDARFDEMLDDQEKKDRRPKIVLGDTSYYDVDRTQEQAEKGTVIIAKAPPVGRKEGVFSKEDFEIDTTSGTVTCPAGHQTEFDPAKLNRGKNITVAFDPQWCQACPLKARCTSSSKGRTITIHRHEAVIQRDRAWQRTPEFKEIYRWRALVERVIRQLKRHGARAARYFGTKKVKHQLVLCALLHNIKYIMRRSGTAPQPVDG